MRKVVRILLVAIAAAIGIGYFTVGPNFFLGGPKTSDIIAFTRSVIAASTPSTAGKVEISPRGLCSHNEDGSYACIVETSIDGADAKLFVAVMKRGHNGDWVPAE